MTPDRFPDPIEVAVSVATLLDRTGVPYVIGGSIASSLHGEPRSTNDVDFVVDLREEHIRGLLAGLGDEYYVDSPAVHDAVASSGSFNVIHLNTAVKVDMFVIGDDAFDRERLTRRQPVRLSRSDEKNTTIYLDTAEDTIVRKLEWFRRGGEVSERQWRDVLGIMRLQGARLDSRHMRTWAERLRVSDLLDRAAREA
jgi:hypothetical protein